MYYCNFYITAISIYFFGENKLNCHECNKIKWALNAFQRLYVIQEFLLTYV